MLRFIFYLKVFRRKLSSRFARKFKFKFDRKHFPNVTLYILLECIQPKIVLCASRELLSLSLIANIFRMSRFIFFWKVFRRNNSSGPLLCNTLPANLCKPAVQSIGYGSGIPKSKSCFILIQFVQVRQILFTLLGCSEG